MLQFCLMGAQAAGSIVGNYMSYKNTKAAAELEQQQLGLRMQQEVLASNQQSIMNLRQLEETLASQRVMFAARGVDPSQGTAQTIAGASKRAYSQDEQARKLSLGFLKSQREMQMGMSRIGVAGAKMKFGLSMFGTASDLGTGMYYKGKKEGMLT